MKLRLVAITYCILGYFTTSTWAATRQVFAIPAKNSMNIKGQDRLTVNPNKRLPQLSGANCASRRYAGFIVTDAAEAACKLIKNPGFTQKFKKYPKSYRPVRPSDEFEIPGNPYYIYPVGYKGQTFGDRDADFAVINEKCQLVGVVVMTKFEVKNSVKKAPKTTSRKRKRAIRPSRSYLGKCRLEITNPQA
ncbi:hypothetical protein HI914_07461 [Erysiphe necator]|nr:hypothetical protein HI914_07461 [Erysiphe necator]